MSIGSMARAVLGDRWFPVVGRYYRAVFVDLEKVVDSFPVPAPGWSVLDVGGGDGELINVFLARHAQARVTMIDLKRRLGNAIRPALRDRVEILPSTSIRDLVQRGHPPPDMVILSDVVHHIPVAARSAFFGDLSDLIGQHQAALVIKDIAPGTPRAALAYLTDRYISGDRTVQQTSQGALVDLVRSIFPESEHRSTNLIEVDPPNYSLIFTVPRGGAARP
jgi:2-polyprenyl-3-methyl-5-hydroxy-6-metoxy-1,4-benzoquinol methylase